MNKSSMFMFVMIIVVMVAACNPTATAALMITSPVSMVEPVSQATTPSLITTDSTMYLCWTNGYVQMTLDGKAVLVLTGGFTYSGKKVNSVQLSRENISVTVDSVSIKFVANGHGDSLDLVVEYKSANTTFNYKLESGTCLWLSKAS